MIETVAKECYCGGHWGKSAYGEPCLFCQAADALRAAAIRQTEEG